MNKSGSPAGKPSPLEIAKASALRGGLAGAAATFTNVLSLMWIRTTIAYQYKNQTNFPTALRQLYRDGGVWRFYRALGPTLIQAPLLRFGDTACNAGTLAFFEARRHNKSHDGKNSYMDVGNLPMGVRTACASLLASCFRICLMPVDTIKVTLQVSGTLKPLVSKVHQGGIKVLYHGSAAAWTATAIAHYPWYFTFNSLEEYFPSKKEDAALQKLQRRAGIGFCASLVSDLCSNSFKLIKVQKQSHQDANVSYRQIIQEVVGKNGVVRGLLLRGLETKLLANGMQSVLFAVLWKHFEETLFVSVAEDG